MDFIQKSVFSYKNEYYQANDQADKLNSQLKECQQSIHKAESDRDDLNRKVGQFQCSNDYLTSDS